MKTFLSQLAAVWSQIGINQRVSLVLATVVVGAGMIGLLAWSHRPQMQLLYGKLAEKDVTEVVSAVQAAGIKYEISGGGTAIYVPSDQVHKLRMTLASK